jgi:hypothetical protein
MRKILVLALFAFSMNGFAQALENADEMARNVTVEFLKAFKENNTDAAMKISSVPFYVKNADLFKERADLEKHLREEFQKNAGKLSGLTHEFKDVHSFESIKDQISEDKEKVFQVLKDGDRVPVVQVKVGDKTMDVAFAVAIRQGKAMVVGVAKIADR